jgi:D-3-phosphoglycerate dehydrogenase
VGRRLKVVVTDYEYPNLDQERRVVEEFGAELVPCQCKSEDDLITQAADADALLNQYALLTSRVIAALKRCKVIVRYGIGVDTIDIPAATGAGILVCNVPLYGIHEVSDHVIALLFAGIRKILIMDSMVKSGIWDCNRGRPISRITGKTLGLVGFGNIPRMVSGKLKAWGMRVLAYDPYVSDEVFSYHGVAKASLEELLPQSDYISCHLPLTPETQHFFDYNTFVRMKKNAFFINTARGPVVNEQGLYKALSEGCLSGAALDVMEEEPPRPDHPLFKMPNVIVTPHIAWYSEQSAVDLQRMAAEEAVRVLRGEGPSSCLNPEALNR